MTRHSETEIEDACIAISDEMDYIADVIDGDACGTIENDHAVEILDEIRVKVKALALFIADRAPSIIVEKEMKEGCEGFEEVVK